MLTEELRSTRQEKKEAKASYLSNKRKNPKRHEGLRQENVSSILSSRIPRFNLTVKLLD